MDRAMSYSMSAGVWALLMYKLDTTKSFIHRTG